MPGTRLPDTKSGHGQAHCRAVVLWMRAPTFQTLVDVFTRARCATTPAIIVPNVHLSCDAQVGLDVGGGVSVSAHRETEGINDTWSSWRQYVQRGIVLAWHTSLYHLVLGRNQLRPFCWPEPLYSNSDHKNPSVLIKIPLSDYRYQIGKELPFLGNMRRK